MTFAILTGLMAAATLLIAGYLLGIRRARAVRRALQDATERQSRQLQALRQQLQHAGSGSAEQGQAEALRRDVGAMIEPLLRQGEAVQRLQGQLHTLANALGERDTAQRALRDEMQRSLRQLRDRPSDADAMQQTLQRMIAPLLERDKEDQDLRNTVQQLLSPLMQREQLGYELSQLETGAGTRGELPRLLDGIADKGGFTTVLLSDEAGLPLAASSQATDLDRLAGVSSLVLLLAERSSRRDGPAPLAVVVHDEANQSTLHRLFRVSDQRLLLTAVATSGGSITPTVLDPALGKLETILSPARMGSN
jgi:hypothetical protein